MVQLNKRALRKTLAKHVLVSPRSTIYIWSANRTLHRSQANLPVSIRAAAISELRSEADVATIASAA